MRIRACPKAKQNAALAGGTNRLASITAATGTRSFTHDARGNLTGDTRSSGGPNVTVSYDGHARLVGYANASGDAQAMAYNGQDERVRVVTTPAGGAADTRMVFYDLDHRIIGEYGATGAADLKAEYIWLLPQVGTTGPFGGDDGTGGYMPLAIAIGAGGSTSQIAWTHGNHLGTPMLTTDANGTAVAPYGTALIGFPGQWRPATTIAGAEFYYNRYRDYDPTLGRYIQADPIGLAGDVNPYPYALGNPVNEIDPLGRQSVARRPGISIPIPGTLGPDSNDNGISDWTEAAAQRLQEDWNGLARFLCGHSVICQTLNPSKQECPVDGKGDDACVAGWMHEVDTYCNKRFSGAAKRRCINRANDRLTACKREGNRWPPSGPDRWSYQDEHGFRP